MSPSRGTKDRAAADRSLSLGRFPTNFRGAAWGLIVWVGLSGMWIGCGDSAGKPDQTRSSDGAVRILSKPAPEKAKLAMPEASIWERPLSDPDLERGRLVWSGTCIQCHSIGLGGAPLIGNKELWSPRIAKGIEILVSHAQQGFYGDVGEMPARGGNEELTDDEVEAAVRFMVSRAQ